MVQLPSPTELKLLKSFNEPFSLTIYAPHIEFDPTGLTNPNRIELKNMLKQAETALLDNGADTGHVRKTLRPARNLLDSREFWPVRNESLALFAHPKFFRYYHLPGGMPYILTIQRGFNLEPLLSVNRDNRDYLVLALNYNHIKLFEGDRFNIRQLRLKNFPDNLEETLNIDEYPDWIETHQVAPASRGRLAQGFHGQYNVAEVDKQLLFRFFRQVDNSLRKFLQKKNKPVILAGVDYLLPIYRQANTSPYILSEAITGSAEHQKPEILRERAWRLLKRKEAP